MSVLPTNANAATTTHCSLAKPIVGLPGCPSLEAGTEEPVALSDEPVVRGNAHVEPAGFRIVGRNRLAVAIPLSCSAGADCWGTVAVRRGQTVLAEAEFAYPAGTSTIALTRVSGHALRAVRRGELVKLETSLEQDQGFTLHMPLRRVRVPR
jgi:hypothetical protein